MHKWGVSCVVLHPYDMTEYCRDANKYKEISLFLQVLTVSPYYLVIAGNILLSENGVVKLGRYFAP